jgi:hypothetical protein
MKRWRRNRSGVRVGVDMFRPQRAECFRYPVDQFSFMESEDGHLNVLVRSDTKTVSVEPLLSASND